MTETEVLLDRVEFQKNFSWDRADSFTSTLNSGWYLHTSRPDRVKNVYGTYYYQKETLVAAYVYRCDEANFSIDLKKIIAE